MYIIFKKIFYALLAASFIFAFFMTFNSRFVKSTDDDQKRYINVSKLQEISKNDDCPVEVYLTRFKKKDSSHYDEIRFGVWNKSDETVNKVTIRYCVCDLNDREVYIKTRYGINMNKDPNYSFTLDKTAIAPGEIKDLTLQIKSLESRYINIEAIVESYKTASGKKIKNPTAKEWRAVCNGG